MEFLPSYFLPSVVFVFGLIIGSFLDVIVCRFHTGKSINGRSRCLSCGHILSWFELFPFFSYVVLKGKCRSCEGYIPLRLLCSELINALMFLYVFLSVGLSLLLPLFLVLSAVLIVTVLYDYRHLIIPDEFVIALGVLGGVYLSFLLYLGLGVETLTLHVLASLAAASFYFVLWLVSKGRWIGFGDAKLALVLGLFLYPLEAFSMIVFSFWIGAGVSVTLLCVQYVLKRGQKHLPFLPLTLTMKSEVPFAPFLIASFVLVFFGRVQVLSLVEYLF